MNVAPPDSPPRSALGDRVILVHGFASAPCVLWPLSLRLRHRGFRPCIWSYRSLFSRVSVHAERFHRFLIDDMANEPCVHIVAHSMGAIVVRAALGRSRIPNLGRMVWIAPPNNGSPIAGWVSPFFGAIFPPTRDLANLPTSYVNQLPELADHEIGIVAASFDLLVPPLNTRYAHAVEHSTLLGTHNSLLISPKVARMTALFLSTGGFHSLPRSAPQERPIQI